MDKNQEFYFNQFKKMFTELDSSKQKMLHEYLEKMDPSERMKHAVELGKRYYYQNNQNSKSNPSQSQVQKPVTKQAPPQIKREVTVKAPVQQAQKVQQPGKVSEQVNTIKSVKPSSVSTNVPNRPIPKKRRSGKVYLRAILVAIVTILVILCGITLGNILVNKNDDIKETNVTSAVTETTMVTEVSSTAEVVETTVEPTPTPTPTPTDIPTPSPVPLMENAPDLTGKVIVIDPGHQEVADENEESCASWLSISKPRCTSGTHGKATDIPEYEYTLELSMVLKSYLEQCGATVYLTRETNDVNMSNQERALFAVDKNPDLYLRIHADGANDSLESGVRVYVPDSGSYTDTSVGKGDILGKSVAEAFGIEFDSTLKTYLYTGLNYANNLHAFQISVGFLTNSDDEEALLNEENQIAAAQAIAEFANIF